MPPVVRRAVLLLLVLAAAPTASAQPPQGVVTDVRGGPALYAANCATCHGALGQGVPPPGIQGAGGVVGMGPSLRGVGARTADFYIRTGYMPLGHPDEQPYRTRVLFDERQIRQLVRYLASFGSGPPIPQPHAERGSVAAGMRLFIDHCAGCHQVVARGGIRHRRARAAADEGVRGRDRRGRAQRAVRDAEVHAEDDQRQATRLDRSLRRVREEPGASRRLEHRLPRPGAGGNGHVAHRRRGARRRVRALGNRRSRE